MASCSDLNRTECRPITKATPVPISTSKKLVEPFNRLKNRANIFRRKNYSSQLSINSHSSSSSISTDQTVPSHRLLRDSHSQSGVILLKRSNSMICPQQRLQTYLNQNNNNNNNNHHHHYLAHRNSICFELAGCSTDESSTDDYQLPRPTTTTTAAAAAANHYWTKSICSGMTDIDEHESLSVNEPSTINPISEYEEEEEEKAEQFVSFCSDSSSSLLLNPNKPSEQEATVILPSTMDVILREKVGEEKQAPPPPASEQIFSSSSSSSSSTMTLLPTSIISSSHSSSSSSASTVILRDHAETIRTRRQCHSSISLLQHQQQQQQYPSFSSSIEEPFYDCKPSTSPNKSSLNFDMPTTKISACTMTGKSLDNLDECSSSEEKAVQTTAIEPCTANICVKRAISSTSLTSSSSASIQTDSSEKKSKMPITTTEETTSTAELPLPNLLTQTELHYKWPHIHERLLGEQACIYWVNYLGSTAIKMSNDGTTVLPSQAIARLKQSTQYARVLPIIGLNISSRGVEFLKHAKERVVICFHDIKSIHCACQDQDLRYFAYVTREHRLMNGMSHGHSTNHENNKETPPSPSPSLSLNGDYHHYCHVFVVKSEAMSTEIMLTFGQVFDIAYRLYRRLKMNGKKCKDVHSPLGSVLNGERHPQLEVIRLSTKSDITTSTPAHSNLMMSSSTHSPATSSSSSSMDERKIFV